MNSGHHGEFELIQQAFRDGSPKPHAATSVANGDDASVHAIANGMELVVSTDASVSGVHWPERFPLHLAADRATCAALSDLAAMGAEACWAWVCVMSASPDELVELGKGVNAALTRYSVELSGGDTVYSPVNALTVTVGGMVPAGKAMCRNRARRGDGVWIIGRAGFAALGLKQWMAGMEEGYFKRYFEEIKPKLEQGVRLRDLGVRCCIDVSDGILQDASHVARASQVGMTLELSRFPGWELLCHKVGEESAIHAAVSGGEDYSLLFTASKEMGWLDSFATQIGICTSAAGVKVQLHGTELEGLEAGFDHFA
ncbi:MAG: thiamine-phosphate kinase [Mariprofundaceae bacterium]|nr:thiamine-phosphate kinase [Mariprofundaceae bacterium]